MHIWTEPKRLFTSGTKARESSTVWGLMSTLGRPLLRRTVLPMRLTWRSCCRRSSVRLYGDTQRPNGRRHQPQTHLQSTRPTPASRDRTTKTAKHDHHTSTRTWCKNIRVGKSKLLHTLESTKRKLKTSWRSLSNAPRSRKTTETHDGKQTLNANKTTENCNILRSSTAEVRYGDLSQEPSVILLTKVILRAVCHRFTDIKSDEDQIARGTKQKDPLSPLDSQFGASVTCSWYPTLWTSSRRWWQTSQRSLEKLELMIYPGKTKIFSNQKSNKKKEVNIDNITVPILTQGIRRSIWDKQ